MKDAVTGRDIVVSTSGDAGPYIIAASSQIRAIQELLENNKITLWVDDNVMSIDGKPEVGFLNLDRSSDPRKVQALLDAAP